MLLLIFFCDPFIILFYDPAEIRNKIFFFFFSVSFQNNRIGKKQNKIIKNFFRRGICKKFDQPGIEKKEKNML